MSADDLTDAQKEEYKKVFDSLAADGALPAKKLSVAIRTLGFAVTQAEMASYFATCDGVTGSLDENKFYVVMAMKLANAEDKQQIMAAFKGFDPDSDTMEKARFVNIMTKMGAKLNDEEMTELLKEVDDGGKINFQKLVDVVMG
jgi:Ca2+-binding EF-hand superfamily protein